MCVPLPSVGTLPAAGLMSARQLAAGSHWSDTINSAAARFVEGMQSGMPRTVPTVLRAVSKMEPRVADGGPRCGVCGDARAGAGLLCAACAQYVLGGRGAPSDGAEGNDESATDALAHELVSLLR